MVFSKYPWRTVCRSCQLAEACHIASKLQQSPSGRGTAQLEDCAQNINIVMVGTCAHVDMPVLQSSSSLNTGVFARKCSLKHPLRTYHKK
eukprot:523302-Pelagomonas_calceolata.AAC.1